MDELGAHRAALRGGLPHRDHLATQQARADTAQQDADLIAFHRDAVVKERLARRQADRLSPPGPVPADTTQIDTTQQDAELRAFHRDAVIKERLARRRADRLVPPGPVPADTTRIDTAQQDADLIAFHRDAVVKERLARWRADRLAPLKLVPGGTLITSDRPAKFQAAWLQFVGTFSWRLDVTSAHYHQHIDVVPNEVLLLPLEVASYLLNKMPTLWGPAPDTVVPRTQSFSTDPATGLDTVYVAVVPCWGLTPEGVPYFDPDNGPSPGDAVRLVVENGLVYAQI